MNAKVESLSKKLLFGTAYLFTGSAFVLVINAITLSVIARTLGVKGFGLYTSLLAFIGLFQFLSDFGLNRAALRMGSRDIEKAKVGFGNALAVKLITIFPFLLLISLFGLFAGYRDETLYSLMFFALSIMLDSFGALFVSVRRILGDFKVISFFRGLRTLINLIVIIIALKAEPSVLSLSKYLCVLSGVSFSIAVTNTILLLKPKVDLSLVRDLVKDSVVFSFNDFFSKAYLRLTVVILSCLSSLHVVGIFSAAIRFTKIATLFPRQVRVALLPTIYRLLDCEKGVEISEIKDEKRVRRIFKNLTKYMALIGVPITLFIAFFSPYFIQLIFGSKFLDSILLLQILSLFILLRFLQSPFSLYYLGFDRHKELVRLQALSTIPLLFLNLFLIPEYGTLGACIAVVSSELFLVYLLFNQGREFGVWNKDTLVLNFGKPILSGLFAYFVVVNYYNFIFVQATMFFVFYLTFLFLLRFFDNYDKNLLLNVFNKGGNSQE